ncbi:MAG TPA: PBP1A family penicillin-binding protein, partial [Chthoniobacteraceae bacterium]|nr:PBP1A family penicillin-binding protein [Chthoniobacteraceae bacterium]
IPFIVARKNKKSKKKHGCFFWLFILGLLGFVAVCVIYGLWAQTFNIKDVEHMTERSAVYDMDGKVYSPLKGGENRVIVSLDDVSPNFINALLAREDTRFYHHDGIDPIGIARAIVRNVIHLHLREGASTLTQQLARNSFPLGGKTLNRKLLEAFVALRIERNYSKKQILEFYVNRIYFGPGFYGVEEASQSYFNKHAKNLTLGEAAMLAGLIRGPTKFSPFKNLKGAYAQRDTVLDRMVELKMITAKQADDAKAAKIAITKPRPPAQDTYAMDMVVKDLYLVLTDEQIDEGGLKIYTTIDPALQKAAQTATDAELRKVEQRPGYAHPKKSDFTKEMRDAGQDTPYLQGAAIVVDNRTGGIRAIVGGRDYQDSNYDRALLASRQVGSTFKPFVYATAFAHGLSPSTPVDDSRIRPGEIRGAPANWSPANSDDTYGAFMPAEEGLIQSRNTMSVRIGNIAGISAVQQTADAVGLGKIPSVPSIYIGSFDATLRDLTTAYTILANEGTHHQTYIIERVDDSDGNVLYRAPHITAGTAGLTPQICDTVTAVMEKVLDHGTAAAAHSLGFNKIAAGKTGTTNDYKDAWFVGYTKSLTCGVWVGLDQPETIMPHGYGSALALPIWVDVMDAAPPQRYPATALPVAGGQMTQGPSKAPEPEGLFRTLRKFFGGQ